VFESRPVQTRPDDDHGRQRQDDISRECKLDPSVTEFPLIGNSKANTSTVHSAEVCG
jgi:hypothetical protein